jgi:hypothetical protein
VNDLVSPYQAVLFSLYVEKKAHQYKAEICSAKPHGGNITLIASKASYAIRFKAVISNDKNRK